MSYQKINVHSFPSEREQQEFSNGFTRIRMAWRRHIEKLQKPFYLYSYIQNSAINGNNGIESYIVQLFSSSIQIFASQSHVCALSKSSKSYMEWPVEYLLSKELRPNCARKSTLSQHQERESLSTCRERNKQFPNRKKGTCRSFFRTRETGHVNTSSLSGFDKFRTSRGQFPCPWLSYIPTAELNVETSKEDLVNNGTGYSWAWLDDIITFQRQHIRCTESSFISHEHGWGCTVNSITMSVDDLKNELGMIWMGNKSIWSIAAPMTLLKTQILGTLSEFEFGFVEGLHKNGFSTRNDESTGSSIDIIRRGRKQMRIAEEKDVCVAKVLASEKIYVTSLAEPAPFHRHPERIRWSEFCRRL